ncbi:unnamed protein product [Callosobruchus maculatus]|uniref:Uncharacterized protein n=1 Tax=Callosobruchus maculatus TaxID=64391 RepID=A0A653C4S8_CALMS|nr:unnamed protein product [Callosobruchus maculatus]
MLRCQNSACGITARHIWLQQYLSNIIGGLNLPSFVLGHLADRPDNLPERKYVRLVSKTSVYCFVMNWILFVCQKSSMTYLGSGIQLVTLVCCVNKIRWVADFSGDTLNTK